MITSISPKHAWPFPADAGRLGQLAKSKGLAVAVKRGMYQIQQVTYGSDGVSTIKPVTGWVTCQSAIEALS